jgi:hypothetical protein
MDDRIFYGPYSCAVCGKLICKASYTQGGESFDYPAEPIYPNTEWKRHNCASVVPSTISSHEVEEINYIIPKNFV